MIGGLGWINLGQGQFKLQNLGSSGDTKLTVQASSGQSGSYFEVLANAGGEKLAVDSSGNVAANKLRVNTSSIASTQRVKISAGGTTSVGLSLLGGTGSAHIQDWMDNAGTVLSSRDVRARQRQFLHRRRQ